MPRTRRAAGTTDPDPVLQQFGRRLRQLRAEREWSQEHLAECAGLDRSYVSSLERGEQDPRLRTIRKLAQALGRPPGELLAS